MFEVVCSLSDDYCLRCVVLVCMRCGLLAWCFLCATCCLMLAVCNCVFVVGYWSLFVDCSLLTVVVGCGVIVDCWLVVGCWLLFVGR